MTVRVEIVAEISGVGIAAAGEFYDAVQAAVMDVLRETGARPVSIKMREVRPNGDRKRAGECRQGAAAEEQGMQVLRKENAAL